MPTHREFRFVRVPDGMPTPDCFELVETAMPEIGDGQVLARTHFLSIDPYMRRAMSGSRHYAGLQPGMTMIGRGAGIVIETRHPGFEVGDAVQGEFGWRDHVALAGDGLHKLPTDLQPLSLSVGVLGQSAATAWVGLIDIANIKPGETVVVSAAAGAVGSAVGQIARIKGCRTVGIAGGAEKCRHVIEDLGFDDCVDNKAGNLGQKLGAAVPEGIDIYYDNVGGETLEAALLHVNDLARVPICGQISRYNATEPSVLRNVDVLLDKAVMLQGFRISHHLARRDEALEELTGWWREGRLNYRETVAKGLENAPQALASMLGGANYGKQVVQVV